MPGCRNDEHWELLVNQVLVWKGELTLFSFEQELLSLPREFKTISVQSTKRESIGFLWVSHVPASQVTAKVVLGPWNRELLFPFPEYINYYRYIYERNSSKGIYFFLKYLEQNFAEKYSTFQARMRYNFYPFFTTCPELVHSPKLFSWNETSEICEAMNGSLPEFYSRKDQTEFIHILKDLSFLFPMEAVYIGFRRIFANKVPVNCFCLCALLMSAFSKVYCFFCL